MTRFPKISFCTVSMNRLHHIKHTLPRNLSDTATYRNAEFIVLDYSSSDGLEDYIRTCHLDNILAGRLRYYRFAGEAYFRRSHSRNMLFKLATGDIVCNIDADNYVGVGFADFVANSFSADENIVLAPTPNLPDYAGKVCVSKVNFLRVSGYDERMNEYGYEDFDFINRLIRSGAKLLFYDSPEFLHFIPHGDEDRLGNSATFANLEAIIIQHHSWFSSTIVSLYFDGSYVIETIVEKDTEYANLQSNEKPGTDLTEKFEIIPHEDQGLWSRSKETIWFTTKTRRTSKFDFVSGTLSREGADRPIAAVYCDDSNITKEFAVFRSQVMNRNTMIRNRDFEEGINSGGFGTGVVFKDFDLTNQINVC